MTKRVVVRLPDGETWSAPLHPFGLFGVTAAAYRFNRLIKLYEGVATKLGLLT